MGQALNLLLVFGAIGAIAVGVIKRCEWFNICDNGGGNDVTDSFIHPESGTNINPKKTEKVLKKRGQDSGTIAPQITQQLANSPISDDKQAALRIEQRQASCKVVSGKLMAVNSSGAVIGPCQSGIGLYARARFSRIAI